MKKTTQDLLDVVGEAHDWREGQVYGGNGTQLSSTDICRVCGLERHWFSDQQNGVSGEYSFSRAGTDISLREAAKMTC